MEKHVAKQREVVQRIVIIVAHFEFLIVVFFSLAIPKAEVGSSLTIF